MLGPCDSFVGFRRQLDLGTRYPHATVLLVDGAGHALPHERPDVVQPILANWLATL
jgi:pimeloyl-ACP methyl ester carboxylesterase